MQPPQRLLSASCGSRRVTIGWDPPERLRALSDGRELTCPGCGAPVVLHAGSVRAHHFAHLPGAVCTLPQTEPETEEHRAGKLLLARWMRERVPDAEVTVEAYIPDTGQRADILLEIKPSRLHHAPGESPASIIAALSSPEVECSPGELLAFVSAALPPQQSVRSPAEPSASVSAALPPQQSVRSPAEPAASIAAALRPRRIAVEFQCANLSPREWRRRHQLYREAGIEDLWILGGSRCRTSRAAATGGQAEQFATNLSGSVTHNRADGEQATADDPVCVPPTGEQGGEAILAVSHGSGVRQDAPPPPKRSNRVLRTGELERALLNDGVPLLFLDPVGSVLPEGTLARFRPAVEAQHLQTAGHLSAARLLDLDFPWSLLERQAEQSASAPSKAQFHAAPMPAGAGAGPSGTDACAGTTASLWQWLEQRYRVTPGALSPLFGVDVPGQEVVRCEARLWQAGVYYRFIHQQVGMKWWLPAVETWARAFLPLVSPLPLKKLQRALRSLQEYFAAAGLLTLPVGQARSHARIFADLDTLPHPPDREEALRIARYRRLIDRKD